MGFFLNLKIEFPSNKALAPPDQYSMNDPTKYMFFVTA